MELFLGIAIIVLIGGIIVVISIKNILTIYNEIKDENMKFKRTKSFFWGIMSTLVDSV